MDNSSKSKKIKCPKCGYSWNTIQATKKKRYICCSRCKGNFKNPKFSLKLKNTRGYIKK